VGKSTLFNALVKSSVAAASNFPFTTIAPNTANAVVPDARLAALASFAGSKAIPWQLEVKDIAGLVEGASKGLGLGNAFLGDIRGAHAILQVVRCFEDPEIIHVCDSPNPTRDISIIEQELVLADAASVEKRLAGVRKAASGRSAEAAAHARLLGQLQPLLEAGLPARCLEPWLASADRAAWATLQLLTQKPMMVCCNVSEEDAASGNSMTAAVQQFVAQRDREQAAAVAAAVGSSSSAADAAKLAAAASASASGVVTVSAKVEAELALLPDEAERLELLQAYGLSCSGLDGLLTATARLLSLHCFYTQGPTETRAWCIPLGATAPAAAGAIHSDMERGFIKAEVINCETLLASGSEKAARDKGLVRSEGKEYVMQAGDVAVFKFNAKAGS
jgi:hypothetical protein